VTGDPTEGALIVAARKFNARPDFFEVGFRKVAENPFESERRRMSVVYENAEKRTVSRPVCRSPRRTGKKYIEMQ